MNKAQQAKRAKRAQRQKKMKAPDPLMIPLDVKRARYSKPQADDYLKPTLRKVRRGRGRTKLIEIQVDRQEDDQ